MTPAGPFRDRFSGKPTRIADDAGCMPRNVKNRNYAVTTVCNSDLLYTGADVRLDPFVRTDVAGGPVVIGPGCIMILPGTVLPGHLSTCLWCIGYSLAEGETLS